MYKATIKELEQEINDLILNNASNSIINPIRQELARQQQLQAQYEAQQKQEAKKQAELAKKQEILARLLAQCSPPPPRTNLEAIKRILESLNNLQSKLLSI